MYTNRFVHANKSLTLDFDRWLELFDQLNNSPNKFVIPRPFMGMFIYNDDKYFYRWDMVLWELKTSNQEVLDHFGGATEGFMSITDINQLVDTSPIVAYRLYINHVCVHL